MVRMTNVEHVGVLSDSQPENLLIVQVTAHSNIVSFLFRHANSWYIVL